MAAIPKNWKVLLKKSNNNLGYHIFYDCKISINKHKKTIEEINTKDIYWHLISEIAKRPTSETKWRDKALIDLNSDDWETIYTRATKLTKDPRVHDLQFKLTHRLVPCRYNLVIWKIEKDNKCLYCNKEDTLEHYFYLCERTRAFWREILDWWKKVTNTNIPLQTYEILFGLPNDEEDPILNQLNYILQMTRHYIYRCNVAKQEDLKLIEVLLTCRENLTLEYKIKKENGTHTTYSNRWTPVLQALTGKSGYLGKATLELEMANPISQTPQSIQIEKIMTYKIMRN
jgi:hypothetical protein